MICQTKVNSKKAFGQRALLFLGSSMLISIIPQTTLTKIFPITVDLFENRKRKNLKLSQYENCIVN